VPLLELVPEPPELLDDAPPSVPAVDVVVAEHAAKKKRTSAPAGLP
jgi:hypothetical protein